jgi:DNA-binding LacI/PurR family transcriptional regulator
MSSQRQRIGIKEVAVAAGVSVTTVSHALNGKGRLPEETRARVRRVADELGYRPNATARNLVVGRTGLLGLAVSQASGPPFAASDFAYFAHLMMAATTEALSSGYALVLAAADGALDPRGAVAVDGAIVVDPVRADAVVVALEQAGVPVVTTGRRPDDGGGWWVDNDHIAGTRSMLNHFQRRGARRIALVMSPIEISYTIDVEGAYRAWCEEHGAQPLIAYAAGDLTERAGYAAASELLALDDPPDAIWATYDRLAFGTLMAAEAHGVDVPGELLLATTATEYQAPSYVTPALTTLEIHPREVGRSAARLLVDLLDDREPEQHNVIVPHRIVARASSRALSRRS